MTTFATDHQPCHGLAWLHTASGMHRLALRLADGFLSRLRGLMLAPALRTDAGLLLTRCDGVHCAFMCHSIDVVYLDRTGRVLKCVPRLRPWSASLSYTGRDAQGRRHPRAAHTLELAAGSIARLMIRPGDQLDHPLWRIAPAPPPRPVGGRAQRGSALVEFVVVGPVLTLLGLALLQYGMLFFAKNMNNHASFMAARAGSSGNAKLSTVQSAYALALVPMYGGGRDAATLATSLGKAVADMAVYARVELLNPTRESYMDWNEAALQARLKTGGKRVIPNAGLAFKGQSVGANSGQTIQDANLIKLRVTFGYEPKIPIASTLYNTYLKWADPGTDAFYTGLVAAGRIPMVSNITLHMQSDAIEGAPVSNPGAGNGGLPVNPGDPPTPTKPPPECADVSCQTVNPPVDPDAPCVGNDCPLCPGK